MTDTDRDKYAVKRIVEFYQRQPTDYADYFFAAWVYQRREQCGDRDLGLDEMASQQSVSSKYLQTVWRALTREDATQGPLAKLQEQWHALAATEDAQTARSHCKQMRAFVGQVRTAFEPHFENLHIGGVHNGSQPFVLWKDKQYADHRLTADLTWLTEADAEQRESLRNLGIDVPTTEDPDGERFAAACQQFCAVFPDAFYIAERGRDYLGKPRDQQEKGRLLRPVFIA